MRQLYVTRRLSSWLLPVFLAFSVVVVGFGSTLLTNGPARAIVTAPVSNTEYSSVGIDRIARVLNLAPSEPAAPRSYQVRSGDTLSTIAAREYGSSSTWPALWWVNRHSVPNPNSLRVGQILVLSGWHPVLGWLSADARNATGAGPSFSRAVTTRFIAHTSYSGGFPSYGLYSFSMLEAVWVWAGGPAGLEWSAATIAECESGGKTWAKNPSSDATGLWQINGVPFPGNPWDGPTNARMAVSKFRSAGGFSPWVCQA